MIEKDTIRLLRECDAGAKMGVSSIDDVLEYVDSPKLKQALENSKKEHDRLNHEIQAGLDRFGDEGKEPGAMAKGMSWLKTNMKLAMKESDATIADLITDGCHMGIKSLYKYLNQYQAADEDAKDITKRLIKLEESLAESVKDFL